MKLELSDLTNMSPEGLMQLVLAQQELLRAGHVHKQQLMAELAASKAQATQLSTSVNALQAGIKGMTQTVYAGTKRNQKSAEKIEKLEDKLGTDAKFDVNNRANADEFLEKKCEQLRREMMHAERRHGEEGVKPFTLIYCDLDLFKETNDQYGHHIGDDVLAAFIKTVKKTIRDSDVLFRMGGDEFLIYLDDNKSGIETAIRIQENLAKVRVPVYGVDSSESGEIYKTPVKGADGEQVMIVPSSSLGIYPLNPEKDPCEVSFIIGKADKAMYVAKGKGDPDGKKQGRIAMSFPDDSVQIVKQAVRQKTPSQTTKFSALSR